MREIKEKSLARIFDHMRNHDNGFITAYRSEYRKTENQQRNKSLLSKLQASRYGITSVEGSYIENYGTKEALEVGEHVFFVVDLNDTGNLLSDLIKFGGIFDQDSILFIKKGAKDGILYGTSKRDNAWPGYGISVVLDNPIFGQEGEFFTKVANRPFILSMSEMKDIPLPQGYMARYACRMTSLLEWNRVEL